MSRYACVAFDAVGTVLRARPRVELAYRSVGLRHGAELSPEVILARFREAFRRQDRVDAERGWRTSERRERQRWRAIVHAVFRELPPGRRDACFRDLYEHFSRGAAWALYDDVLPVIGEIRRKGLRCLLASNFDQRLETVASELGLNRWFDEIVISSVVGYRKPHEVFFRHVVSCSGGGASEVLFVGDDPACDVAAAARAGLHAVGLDRRGGRPGCVRSLTELLECLR